MNSIYIKQKGLTKRKFSLIIIATVILIIVAIIVLYFTKKEENVLNKVPGDAKSILVINTSALSEKLFIDDLGKEQKSRTSILKLIPDSLAEINFKRSGLSFTDKMVLYTLEDSSEISINFIFKIDDNLAFNNFIDELGRKLKFTVENMNKVKTAFIPSLQLLLVWDNNYLSGTKTQVKSDKKIIFLQNTLNSNSKQSILADKEFAQLLNNKFDLLFYSKSYKNGYLNKLNPTISEIESISSHILFNDGELDIKTKLKLKNGSLLDKLFNTPKRDLKTIQKEDSCIANIELNLDPLAFNNLLKNYSSAILNQKMLPFYKAWNGAASISLLGIKSIKNEYITYDYDDDFNKIEIKKIRINKIPDVKICFGINPDIFDSIIKINKPVKSGNDSLLFDGSNYLFKKISNNLLIYSLQTQQPEIFNESTNSKINLELDYQKFIELLTEFNLQPKNSKLNKVKLSNIILKVDKSETINVNSKFLFMNKEKNALFTLIESFQ
jgi:hypothetical protein